MNKSFFLTILLFLPFFSVAQTDTMFNHLDDSGLRQGFWKKHYANGKPAYKAYFVDNKPFGLLMRYHENGNKLAIIDYFDDGSSFAQLFYPSGKLASEGHYEEEQKKSGLWKYYRSNSTLLMEESYESGLLQGVQALYYPDGKVFERRRFVNGQEDGVYEQVDVRGQLVFEMLYKNGMPNGGVRYYYDNNQIRIEGQYKDGVKTGEWQYYEPNGKLERKTSYVNGVASDQAEVDKKHSDYLKSLDKNRGKFMEPEQQFDEYE
ncbi:MAG: toxin-antitoxin system YwqK family antitoxin [Prevotellaceae bacterium]|jgi:antitoxin component YwqK of YwqJK toxin-antitoxin module|nr:toxin-antitoxin system YwqK family antitoxin [Prevotellaceae bacterium]